MKMWGWGRRLKDVSVCDLRDMDKELTCSTLVLRRQWRDVGQEARTPHGNLPKAMV